MPREDFVTVCECWSGRDSGERTQQEGLADRTGASSRGRSVGRMAAGCRRRQAGSGRARNRARARSNWASQGQRCGRCRVRRRAERVIRPAREKNRRRTAHPLSASLHTASSPALALGNPVRSCPGPIPRPATPSLTAHVATDPTSPPTRTSPVRERVLPCPIPPSRSPQPLQGPSAPTKAPGNRRQLPIYPNSSPHHRACNSLPPSAVLAPSIGGFGLNASVYEPKVRLGCFRTHKPSLGT